MEGDIDARLLVRFPHLLARPLEKIYKTIMDRSCWPKLWKTETVTLIPKKSTPESLADLRNLSCTAFFSKLLETFMLDELKDTTILSREQFGGKKGQGVDHILIEIWDYIHRGLEDPTAAVGIMAVDFHKAFNRMCHRSCLDSLRELGAGEQILSIIQSFLQGRKMQIRVNEVLSDLMDMSGGSPQGSILGCYLFCATINKLLEVPAINPVKVPPEHAPPIPQDDSTLPRGQIGVVDEDDITPFFRWRNNPLDDTVEQILPTQREIDEVFGVPNNWRPSRPAIKGYVDDITVMEKMRLTDAITHYTQGEAVKHVHGEEQQTIFSNIEEISRRQHMKINPTKTQLLCISSARDHHPVSYITHEGKNINSVENIKILGFWFSSSPGVGLHVKKMLEKARIRLWSLRKLRSCGLGSGDLLAIYKSSIRPILDYVVPTYHSQLTREMSDEIEQLQATAMKIVYGYKVSYGTVLNNDCIESHADRRKRIVDKFARKNTEGPFAEDWFPKNPGIAYNVRDRNEYLEEHARTTRLANSPIFNMRKILNA